MVCHAIPIGVIPKKNFKKMEMSRREWGCRKK